jgi:alpha-methylacyl-CoA racemase
MGPLKGMKVLEFEAIGPGPFAGMLLADMGADVIVIDRPEESGLGIRMARSTQILMRGKRSVTLDLKSKSGVDAALALIEKADALIEGFRPDVMERLGLGPDIALARNPRLVYGRMTGWGQDGPLAARAGHDINYIALAGVLSAFGRAGQAPAPPLNLVGDFGGGGMLLGFGIACGLVESLRSGKGQVVDAAMVEGASLLAAMFAGLLATRQWKEERGANILDSGSPWYDVYETKDGKYVSIGSIEPKFYADLLKRLGLATESLPKQNDVARWPELRTRFTAVFKTKTRDEWCTAFEGSDACFAPVLTMTEAKRHPHNVARESFVTVAGIEQAAPAPRFSRTPAEVRGAPPERGEGGKGALSEWGFAASDIERLRSLGLGFRE